jgi:hypothetical protein
MNMIKQQLILAIKECDQGLLVFNKAHKQIDDFKS